MNKLHQPAGSSSLRTAAVLVAVIAVLYLAQEVLIPLAFAITLTLILTPAVTWLRKFHIGRIPSVLLVMAVSITAAVGISLVIANQLIEVATELPRYQQNIHNKIEAMRLPSNGGLGRAAASVKQLGQELLSAPSSNAPATLRDLKGRRSAQSPPGPPVPVQMVEEPRSELQYVRDLTKPFMAPLGIFGIVLIFTVFLLIQQNDFRNRLLHLAGLNRLNVMTQALDDATRRVSRYLLLQLLVNAGFGILCGIGLYFIGLPYAFLWGAVAGILRIVPYAGSLVAGLLPFALSLAVFDHWVPPLLVFLLFATLEVVTGNFFEPWLYGSHTGISSLALLLTTVFWAALWGPAGLILSTPLTVCVVVLGRHVPHLSFLHVLLGDQSVLAEEGQLYQRLLAMDDQEARAVAEQYLTGHSLVQLYDSVIIPALTMAEQDRHKGALERTREEFLFLSIKEMLAEFSERAVKSETAADEVVLESKASTGRVFCLAANDEADEIAAAMLTQLLEQAGCAAVSFPVDPALHQVLALVDPSADDVFCISALPPFAFAHAGTLSRQLQLRFPKTKTVIGVWGFAGDTERALQRFHSSRPDKLVTSLADAVLVVMGADVPVGAEGSAPPLLTSPDA